MLQLKRRLSRSLREVRSAVFGVPRFFVSGPLSSVGKALSAVSVLPILEVSSLLSPGVIIESFAATSFGGESVVFVPYIIVESSIIESSSVVTTATRASIGWFFVHTVSSSKVFRDFFVIPGVVVAVARRGASPLKMKWGNRVIHPAMGTPPW